LLHENTEALWFFGILLWYQPVFPALLPEKYAMAKRKKKMIYPAPLLKNPLQDIAENIQKCKIFISKLNVYIYRII